MVYFKKLTLEEEKRLQKPHVREMHFEIKLELSCFEREKIPNESLS